MSDIHSCSYYCTRPACVLAQRDELRGRLEKQAEPVGWLCSPDGHFKRNLLYRIDFPPESLAWQVPIYTAPQQAKPVHALYTNADMDKPRAILDRNGEVVLGLCKRCGKAEVELSEPCVQQAEPVKGESE
jgi:hypothetical protein